MSAKSKIVLVAAFVFGTASTALADEHFDINIFRSAPQSPAFATYMGGLNAYAQVPARVKQMGPTVEETRLFAKGSYAGH